MEQNFKIRPAVISDAEIVFNFISHLEERSFDFGQFKEKFQENISRPDIVYLVAVDQTDEPIGFISCHGQRLLHHPGWVYEIQEMYVGRSFRNRGIGKSLFMALQEHLSISEGEILEVSTHISRSDAKRFYARLGFRNTHVKYVKEMI
jgi:(aminoalkyl)phosphonate N-acetyltransferase